MGGVLFFRLEKICIRFVFLHYSLMVGFGILYKHFNVVSREFGECTILFIEVLPLGGSTSLYKSLTRGTEKRANFDRNILGSRTVGIKRNLTLLQLETRFWGQNYLDLVYGGVRGL